MKKLLLILLAALFTFQAARAQIILDVKTSIDVKAQYTIIKTGIVQVLKNSPRFIIKETGEDYSLWITNIKKWQYGGKNYVDISFEIRTPSFFSRGDLIRKDILSVKYEPNLIQNSYNLNDLSKRLTLLAKGRDFLLKVSDNNKIAATLATVEPISTTAIAIMQSLIKKFLSNVNLKQTNVKLGEAMLAGNKMEQKLKMYFTY